jgi:hypothetical protein
MDLWYKAVSPDTWPSWAIVISGLVAVWVAVRTLRTLERQAEESRNAAEAAKESAKAALKNVEALIKSERPWFVATVEPSAENPTTYRLRIENKGKTPGILNEMFAESTFAERPDSLPLPPTYRSPCIAPNDNLFSQNDSYVVPYDYKPSAMVGQWLSSANHSPTDSLVIYGKLTYTDSFPETESGQTMHETRWCFFWFEKQRRWVRCGPREYSGHRDYRRELV